jgi:mannose-6-phosphate isomerase-like protein (cupin superfamily)
VARAAQDVALQPIQKKEEMTMAPKARHAETTVPSFHDNIKAAAKKNLAFTQTVCKGAFSELVVISIPPTGELGEGAHDDADVILFIVEGKGEVIFGDRKEIANKHDAILVTAGRPHNLRNIGRHDLKLFAVFSPPPSGAKASVHRIGAAAAEEQLRYAWEQ